MKKSCDHFTPTIGCIKDICSCNNNPKKPPFKHEVRVLSTEEVMEGRSSAYEFINFDKQETLEEAIERQYPIVEELKHSVEYKASIAERKLAFMFGAKWQQEQILNFLHSEITERRDYTASKMCEKVIEFINQLKKK